MNFRLLATKFHIPAWRANAVERPRLIQALTAGLDEDRKLTLISAPAGYGKTTLVTGWLHALRGRPLRAAWLSLDDADNDPARLILYWLAAFQQVDGSLREQLQALMNLPALPPVEALLDELINQLAALETPVLLALDDYHAITNPQIHTAVEYFLDHLPAGVHVVITTREDPPLPLARLRANRQMTEMRARDLRFTPEEARQFFTVSQNLPLSEGTLRALDERTEGWAAGLQLAALALQNQPNPEVFIETFRGSHRYVLDYLAEEVIRQQGEEVRAFLTQTSVLDRFNAEACAALTGRADAQALITRLEGANLFIIPLDDERTWYRYHHLFADYLRSSLAPAERIELLKLAANWHASSGLMVQAVRYALLARDADFTADTIQRALENPATWSIGNINLLSSWLDALPAAALERRPALSLHASRIYYTRGRFDLAESCIARAEQALKEMPSDGEVEQLLALVDLYRGSIASVKGEVPRAVDLISGAVGRLAPANHLAHARAAISLANAYNISGEADLAVQSYLRASDEARQAGVLYLVVNTLCSAAQLQIAQGRLALAEQTCRQAIQQTDGARLPLLGLARSILGIIALERDELGNAARYLEEGLALSRQGSPMDDVIWGLIFQARLHAVMGQAEAADAAMQEVGALVKMLRVTRLLILASSHHARVWHMTGQEQPARRWAEEYLAQRAENPVEHADLTLGRILIAAGQLEAVEPVLRPLYEKAVSAGRVQAGIEAALLLALYHQVRKQRAEAQEWLCRSLQMAGPAGFVRLFVDDGAALRGLLPEARRCAPELVDHLLKAQPRAETALVTADPLVEPLSEQEKRVLRLIVAGKSNREIAGELYISVGTAKWHVHNILQKLEVSNRPQAIARARELGY